MKSEQSRSDAFSHQGKSKRYHFYNKGKLTRINLKTPKTLSAGAYCSWHPSGKIAAFAVNKIKQNYYLSGFEHKMKEVFDLASDIVLYNIEKNKKMKKISILISLVALLITVCKNTQLSAGNPVRTICNPMDISYRFQLDEPSRREAADPTIVLFKDTYFLFASKSGGYWYSNDLKDWKFIQTNEIPTEDYAPTAVVIGDTIYFLASSNHGNIYKSADPKSGKWTVAKHSFEISLTDPDFFLDDDNRLYLYWGCSDKNPIYGIELDYKNGFKPIGSSVSLIFANTKEHGWEVPGDFNTNYQDSPWIEGAWMNKHNGKYYLQYAGPGTQFKSYSDGVYTAGSPLGPYKVANNNPFAYKPEGFVSGAGHGSTFADKYGNFWHIGTITISTKHMFERRLGLFPTFFDSVGTLLTDTKYGDYPMIIPDKKITSAEEIFPGWMLLSYKKKITVSSSAEAHPPDFMTDEDIRTYWSAQSGNANEWAILDLGENRDVYAIQINFAEHRTTVLGRKEGLCYQYTIETSTDSLNWKILVDKSLNQSDNSHDYKQLDQKINCRYLRIRNKKVADGNFALSGFRVFGKGNGNKPEAVKEIKITRNPNDRRSVQLKWNKSESASGYIIRYGAGKNILFHSYMIYGDNSLSINSLNANQAYSFTISPFNENGITSGKIMKTVE